MALQTPPQVPSRANGQVTERHGGPGMGLRAEGQGVPSKAVSGEDLRYIPDLHPSSGSALLPQQPSSKKGARHLEGISPANVSKNQGSSFLCVKFLGCKILLISLQASCL